MEEALIFFHSNCSEGRGDSHVVMREIGETICKALVAYHDGDFASAVNLLHHIRYRLFAIGGSHAQVTTIIPVWMVFIVTLR